MVSLCQAFDQFGTRIFGGAGLLNANACCYWLCLGHRNRCFAWLGAFKWGSYFDPIVFSLGLDATAALVLMTAVYLRRHVWRADFINFVKYTW